MLSTWIAAAIYIGSFFAFMFGILFWRRSQRKDRRPFAENFKLLRGPGETQRREVARLDETIGERMLVALGLPVVIAGILIWITTHLSGVWQIVGLAVTLLALLGALYLVTRLLVGMMESSGNRYLGYFGERIVAD